MFVLRTIKNGRVRIHGRWFRPDGRYLAYDGRLEGMRYAFGVYDKRARDMVALWGTVRAYASRDPDALFHGPDIVDGSMPWAFWHEETPREKP